MRQYVVCVCITLAAVCASAADLFRCGEPYANLEYGPGQSEYRAVEDVPSITRDDFATRYRGVKPVAFTGFAPSSGVTSIDSYMRFERDEEIGDDQWRLSVAFRVTRGKDVSYFEVREDLDNSDKPGTHPARPQVRKAETGGSVPILKIETTGHWRGAHASGSLVTQSAIDFRKGARVVRLSCNDYWMGGACDAHAFQYEPKQSLRCVWSQADSDFTCTERRFVQTDRGERESVRRFELFSGKVRPAPEAPTTFASLDAAARAEGDARTVNGIGTLRRVATLDAAGIYAVPAAGQELTLQIFALAHSSSPRFTRVPVGRIADFGSRSSSSVRADATGDFVFEGSGPAGYTLMKPALATLAVREWEVLPLSVLTFVVADGEARALFLVGADDSRRPALISAVRLASTAVEYLECDRFLTPRSVSHFEWNSAAKQFDVRIEPGVESFDGEDRQEPRGDCSTAGAIRWDESKGWVLDQSPDCAGPRRVVSIADDGTLVASAPPSK